MTSTATPCWAKLNDVGAILLLAHHCADVAACMEALLRQTLLNSRLAELAGLESLHPVQVARLSVLAALHDAGKANLHFQTRKPGAGHLGEILDPLFKGRDTQLRANLLEALDVRRMQHWAPGDSLADYLIATFSHHGRPVMPEPTPRASAWQTCDGYDPIATVRDLVEHTRRWFPEAWEDGPELPDSAAFQHAWAGLLTLADWIGSDQKLFFQFSTPGGEDRMSWARRRATQAMRQLGLATAPARQSLGTEPVGYRFMEAAIGRPFDPYPAQAGVVELEDLAGGSLAVLEAATGSGKTEAALGHFMRLFQEGEVDGLYFALPTRTAATQIYRRVCEAVAGAFPDEERRPATVLAVPGYLSADGMEGETLAPFQVRWPAEEGPRAKFKGWAAENSKRYLAGAIAVGTIDQVLLSSLMVPHAHLRASSLLRHLLVVDEVHASDVYMSRILEAVLDHHLGAGGHALLMSATLGSAARAPLTAPPGSERRRVQAPAFEEALHQSYPALTVARRRTGWQAELQPLSASGYDKAVRLELSPTLESPAAIATRALHAAREGARVLIIRNTVGGCLEVQRELENQAGPDSALLFRCHDRPTPHHGRYAPNDRRLLDEAVEDAFGKERSGPGLVAVATQTVEQSLDLDADLLITDLTYMDVLLQRIGRLHRHAGRSRPEGYETARVVVLTPGDRDLSRLIEDSGESKGVQGVGGLVYPDLRVLEATWAKLEEAGRVELPRDNRELVEAATHPEVLAEVVAKGNRWQTHDSYMRGTVSADGKQAKLNLLRRDKAFGKAPPFPPKGERRIPTRLGDEDRRVRFDPEADGPFGSPVDVVHVPHWMADGVPPEAETAEEIAPVAAADRPGAGFSFRFGPKTYLYDRLGLRDAAAEPGTQEAA